MAANMLRIDEYSLGDDFNYYCEKMESYFYINSVTEDRMKCVIFLDFVGADTYKILRAATHPHTVNSKTYAEIIEILKNRFVPKKNIMCERFAFYKRDQLRGETISDYVKSLESLAETCAFGDFHPWALRDRLVMGLMDRSIQEELMSLDAGFEETQKIAIAKEVVANCRKKQRNEGGTRTGQDFGRKKKVQANSTNRKDVKCYHCQGMGHYAYQCSKKAHKSGKRI